MVNASDQEWIDTGALSEIANAAGVSLDAARKVAAGLAELPARQQFRICVAAQRIEARRAATARPGLAKAGPR